MQFENHNDILRYLLNSIIPFNDKLVYIRDIGLNNDSYTVYYRDVFTGADDSQKIKKDHEFQNMKFKGGCIAYGQGLFYLTRYPVRRVQAGLTSRNLVITPLTRDVDAYMEFKDIIQNKSFQNLVEGNFPTIAEALESEDPTPISRCFGVHPLLKNARQLFYRKETIGEVVGDVFYIYEDFEFTKDILTRTMKRKGEVYEIRSA